MLLLGLLLGSSLLYQWAENKVRETSPFTIATNSITYFGSYINIQVEDLYDKTYKSLKKKIEEDTRKWKDLQCFWVDRINIEKWQSYQRQFKDSMQCPKKFLQNSSQSLKNQYLTSYAKAKKPRLSKIIL